MNTFFYKDIAYPDGVIGGKDYYNPVIYSTNERLIGVGENNKPLYQKTVISNTLNSEETETVLTGVDSLKVISLRTNNTYPFYVSLYNVSGSDTEYGGVFFENNNVILYNFSRAHAVVIEVVLQYTKVTDTAGSAPYNNYGVPTVRYTTDEQVIGTWFGETLYENFIDLGSATIISPNGVQINIGSIDVKQPVNAFGIYDLVIEEEQTLPLLWHKYNGNMYFSSSTTAGCNKLILQYTKTTD